MSNRRAADIIITMVIFALAGITTMFVSDFILSALEVKRWTPAYFVLIPFVLMPSHNILLLFYSSFFGRFRLFWEREKKILRFLLRKIKPETE